MAGNIIPTLRVKNIIEVYKKSQKKEGERPLFYKWCL